MNHCLTEVWSAVLPAERQWEVYHRYILGVYDFAGCLRRNLPHIFIEGCYGAVAALTAECSTIPPRSGATTIPTQWTTCASNMALPSATRCPPWGHVSAVPNGCIDIELDRLREIHSKLKMQTSQMQMDEKEKNSRTELAQKVSEAGGLTARLAETLINRVFVYPDNQVEIVWKMKDFCMEEM